MKKQILKISVVILLIVVLTMANFIFVGKSFVSYAIDNITTNQSNVNFSAYFKDENGNKIETKEGSYKQTEEYLYLLVEVKNEGYINSTITLEENSNFKLVETESSYVEKIENNVITLYNITAGTTVEIPVKIEPVKEEQFSTGLLDVKSKLTINGVYKDSSEKDKKIETTREVNLKFVDEVVQEDTINDVTVITNKIAKINGEEKRVVQLSWNMGLKENSYPIKEIAAKIEAPKIGENEPEIEKIVNLNTMTSYNYKYEGANNEITLKNEQTQEGKITWKTSGTENIILTYIYDKDVDVSKVTLKPEIKITLYNQKEITATSEITIGEEQKDSIIEVTTKNQENEIYKSKQQYLTRTSVKLNLAKAIEEITVQENQSTYMINETENQANITYSKTMIKKAQFEKILGTDGKITIKNEAGEIIDEITSSNQVNEQGYITIDYTGKNVKAIQLTTTKPIAEGTLEINHIKTINAEQKDLIKQASYIHNIISYKYNQEEDKQAENNIQLKDTVTESKLTINKAQLSTVVNNEIEMRVTLLSNNEKYDLYENPEIAIQLPEQVENIEITNISKVYDDNQEFGEPQYFVDGRIIKISLQGKQKEYKASSVEGITIAVETKITVNKKSATSDEEIKMVYKNQNALTYNQAAEVGNLSIPVKIVAPKDITTVNSIKELSVETIGEEENTKIMMEKGAEAKQVEAQMEIINSNAVAINDVKILGSFPTNDSTNNMGITIKEGINVSGVDNAKVYYSENENATDDINNSQNGWAESTQNIANSKKYLIVANTVDSQSSLQATYKMEIPENLEYNLTAKEGYSIAAVNSQTGTTSTLNSTQIEMETGVGPKVESQIKAVVGGSELRENGIVKNGEVIKYQIEVSNTGSEDVTGITVTGQVPEGTTIVEPMENYEYTGASYYKETNKTSYEGTIETIKVGEVITKEYEVRVNSGTSAGTILENKTQVKYGEAIKENTITNKTESANLRISVKRTTDRKIELYPNNIVKYYAIVENISNEKQENVKVLTNLPENLEILDVELLTGVIEEVSDDDIPIGANEKEDTDDGTIIEPEVVTDENQKVETKQYSSEIDIGTLETNEVKVLSYSAIVKNTNNNIIEFSANVKDNKGVESKSNVWKNQINKFEITLSMETSTTEKYVKAGDKIEYIIKIENKGQSETAGLYIEDQIPEQLTITKITANGEEVEKSNTNKVAIPSTVGANSESILKIETVVDESLARTEPEVITNVAKAIIDNEAIATTSEISHIIEATQSNNENGENSGENGGENGTNNNIEDNNIAKGNKMIEGIAWFDENANGKKDQGEKLLSNIKVKLLNVETNNLVKDQNGNVLEVTTNEKGVYVLNNIGNGKYIVIFEYDKTQYTLTKYKVEGISETENSNAMSNELLIAGNRQTLTSTDIVEIKDNNISDINIGLIKLKNFDLQLDKYVSKILIQDKTGSTIKQYDNSKIAKAELDSKKVNGSTVIIEYTIKVTNNGEIEGYAKKVADYMPSDLKFSSELNKDWYQSGNTLYNSSLANEKIAVGESKIITLTLTKSMTENNTGLIYNTAEIAEDYNELGIADGNSTPGNKAQGENDMSEADVILSIKTGGVVYITITIIAILALGAVAFIIKKKNKREI